MAKLGVRMVCVKHVMFTFNFIWLILGILIVLTGASLVTIYKEFEAFLETSYFKPSEILVAAGAIMFFISLVGCVGAVKESTMLVNVYGVLLTLLVILEIGAGLAAFAMRWTILDSINENMVEALQDFNDTKESWDFVQQSFHCCGVQYASDWASEGIIGHNVIIKGLSFTVPFSCCNYTNNFCYKIYTTGCFSVIEDFIRSSSVIITFTVFTVVIIQVLGVMTAFKLAKAIRRLKTEAEMIRQEQFLNNFFEQRPHSIQGAAA